MIQSYIVPTWESIMETWHLRHRKTSGTSQLSKEFVSSTCAQLVSTVNRSAAANSWQHFSTRFGSHRPMNCCHWHKFLTLFIYIDIYGRFEITTSDSRVCNSFAKLGQHGESQPPDFPRPSWKVRRHRDLRKQKLQEFVGVVEWIYYKWRDINA